MVKKIDQMTQEQIDAELRLLDLEEKRLRLEHLRMTVENERARRDGIARAHESQQRSIDDANEQIRTQQAICRHRKGGKNLTGILNGNDANYSVIHHTYAWGETRPMCTRCGKEWFKPKREDFEDVKDYRAAFKEYTDALQFPTDNEPSGTTLFAFSKAS